MKIQQLNEKYKDFDVIFFVRHAHESANSQQGAKGSRVFYILKFKWKLIDVSNRTLHLFAVRKKRTH